MRYFKVSLANKRQITIEKKILNRKETDEIDDTLNYAFRKLIFKKLRSQFFVLKSLNLKLLNKIDLNILDEITTDHIEKDSFICSIERDELAEVLLINDEQKLNEISDHLSYSCIKSLTRLIKLLVSENLKIMHILKLSSIPLNNELISHIKHLIQTLFEIYNSRNISLKTYSELKNLTKIISLISDNNESVNKPEFAKKLSNEHNLTIHLRHTLLSSMSLYKVDDKMSGKKREILHSLKSSFEYCSFYLKKISNEIEETLEIGNGEEQLDISKFLTGKIINIFQSDFVNPLFTTVLKKLRKA